MSHANDRPHAPSLGECVTHALIWEATAAKPGNVTRGADFENMTFADMTTAAVAIGSVFNSTNDTSLGKLILQSVQAMRSAVGKNTHLGTILLLAPLTIAKQRGGSLATMVSQVVAQATDHDTQLLYEAIRLASPGGLGKVDEGDVADAPTIPLQQAMRLAAERDLVARQYVDDFQEVFTTANTVLRCVERGHSLHDAIVHAHIELMSREPDSLIARKCGLKLAKESADRATAVLEAHQQGDEAFWQAAGDLDFWLRADGHRRNPGTTADVIGAALFVLLVEHRISWPARFYTTDLDTAE